MSAAPKSGAFSPAIMSAIIVAGVFSFAAFFALSAFAPDLSDGDDGGVHALSKSAVGYGALKELLNAIGVPVLASRGPVSDGSDGVIVYSPPAPEAFENLEEFDAYSVVLLIMPKWVTQPDPAKKGWVRKIGPAAPFTATIPYSGDEIRLAVEFDAKEKSVALEATDAFGGAILNPVGGVAVGSSDGLQFVIESEHIEPILFAGEGRIVFGKLKGKPIYVLAEPDLLNTYGLRETKKSVLAASLFDMIRTGGPVVFDLTLHGLARPRNIVRLALEPPLLSATACIMFAALLLALASAARFGPPERTARIHDFGKSALAENSAALIRMAGRESAFGARYGALVRRRIAKTLRAATASASEIDAIIERVAASRGAAVGFSALQQSIAETRDSGKLVQEARRLRRFEEEFFP